MSFGGGGQGSVRYAVLVTDQATAPLQNINRQFTTFGQQMTTSVTKVNAFNSAINSNSKTFTAQANAIKSTGPPLLSLQNNLKANTTQATGLGTSIKNTATKFAGFATGLSATTAGALQLAAGFRDYNDAQIAVERVTRKNSLAHEALTKAQGKLNALTSKGVTSGKEYEQAQLDVSQAQQMVSIQTQLLGEAQERLFDSQTQFAVSIIPTTLGALGTLGSAFKDLGGAGGIGGLATKFKDFGGGIKSTVMSAVTNLMGSGGLGGLTEKLKGTGIAVGGLKSNLLGMAVTGAVIGGVTIAALALADGINKVAKQWSSIKEPVSALEASLDKSGKSLDTFNLSLAETEVAMKAGVSPAMVAMDSILGTKLSKTILTNTGYLDENGKQTQLWKDAVAAATQELIKQGKIVPQTGKAISDLGAAFSESSADFVQHVVNLTKGGAKAGQIYDYLKRAKIDDTKITEIQIRAYDEITKTQEAVLQPANEWIQGLKDQKKKTEDTIISLHEYAKIHGIVIPAAIQNDIKAMQDLIATHEHLNNVIKSAPPIKSIFGGNVAEGTADLTGKTKEFADQAYAAARGSQTLTGETDKLRQSIIATGKPMTTTNDTIGKLASSYDTFGDSAGKTNLQLQNSFGGTREELAKLFATAKAKGPLKIIEPGTLTDIQLYNNGLAAWGKTAKTTINNTQQQSKALVDQHAALLQTAQGFGMSEAVTKKFTDTTQLNNAEIRKQNDTLRALNLAYAALPPTIDDITNATYQGTKSGLDFINQTKLSITQTKAQDAVLRQLVGAYVELDPNIELTSSQLKEMTQSILEGKGAAQAYSDIIDKQLSSAVQKFQSLLDTKTVKDFNKAFKDIDFGDIGKGLKGALKDAFEPLRDVAKRSGQLDNLFKAIADAGDNLSQKNIGKAIKEIADGFKDLGKTQPLAKEFGNTITSYIKSAPDAADAFKKLNPVMDLFNEKTKDGKFSLDDFNAVSELFNTTIGKAEDPTKKTADAFGEFADQALQVKINAVAAASVVTSWGLALAGIADAFSLMRTGAITNLDLITNHKTIVNADPQPALDAIKHVIGNFAGWVNIVKKANPAAQINIISATKSITRLIGNFNGYVSLVEKSNPKAQINIGPATKLITRLIGNFNGYVSRVEKANPAVKIDITGAVKSIDRLIGDLNGIPNITRTVTIKTNKIGAQHGLHTNLTEDTLIQAHKGERVDIGPDKGGTGAGMRSLSSSGGGTGGDTIIENHIHIMDETIMRKIQARQGRQRYTFGA